MIELKNIYTEISDNRIYLKSDCLIDGEQKTLWYSTAIENEKYIATSNADSFILVLFIYSVFNNKKLKSNVPISSELNYGLLEVLVPSFSQMGLHCLKSDFEFQKIDETIYPDAQGVGTAMSFGVDSFYTFLDSQNHNKSINTLTLFNAGAFGQDGGEKAEELFESMKQNVSLFANKTQRKFVWVDTNTNEILHMPFNQTSVFRNFSCVFVLQKLFKNYFYASSATLERFRMKSSDTAYYELLISKAIRGNSLEFHISGLNTNRLDKTISLSDHPLAKQYLNVCQMIPENKNLQGVDNCSKCYKCTRTMLTLDALGKLEEFGEVFSLNIFKDNKSKFIAELIYRAKRMNENLAKQVLNEMKKRNYHIPLNVYWYLFLRALRPINKKLFKNG